MKRAFAAVLALILVAVAVGVGLWQISRARCFALTGRAICRVETARAEVGLSFDDGPTDLGVATILPLLQAHGAHATFFLIGGELVRRPDLAKRLLQAGEELGDHSYTHVRMVGRSMAFYDGEIERTEALLRQAGASSGLFRPPYAKKLVGLPISIRRHGLKMILWDVEDPVTDDPHRFAAEVQAKARPGSIILVHAMYGPNRTAREALPAILDGLQAKGLRVVTVGQLLRDAQPPSRR